MESEEDLELDLHAPASIRVPPTCHQGIDVDGKSRLRLGGDGFLSASGGNEFGRRGFIRQFNNHDLGVEFLEAMKVEINRSTIGVRLGHYAQSILKVSDALPFRDRVHKCLLLDERIIKLSPARP